MMIKSVEVVGDSGEVYTIQAFPSGAVACSCPAFRFANTDHATVDATPCKHIRFIAACFAVPA